VKRRSKDGINAEEERGISITLQRRLLQLTGTKATAKMMVDDNDDDTIARGSRFSVSAAARGPQTAAGLTSASYHHRNQHHHQHHRCRRHIVISISLVASLSARLK